MNYYGRIKDGFVWRTVLVNRDINGMKNTHRLNMLIDFLQGSKKNRRLLYKLLTLLYIIQLPIVIYLAAFISPGEYPVWWQAIVDWGQHNIPSAQGWAGRTIAHREEMPAIYMVWFIFGITSIVFGVLLDNKCLFPPVSFVEKGLAHGIFDTLMLLCAVVGAFWWCYLRGQSVPITDPLIGFGGLVEHMPGLLLWTLSYVIVGAGFIANPVILLRQKIGKVLKHYMNSKE